MMDIYSTFMLGLKWGLIADACWIIPYFGLLFYHFYKMETDYAYAMRYDQCEREIKRVGTKEAVIEESKVRIISMRLKMLWSQIKRIPTLLSELLSPQKKGVRKK